MTCGQVWWPKLRICALHLTHPNAHTHSHNAAVPGEQLGVRCLAQGSYLSRGVWWLIIHSKIKKLQISKSTPKSDILIFLNSFSRTITNGSFGLQSCFPVFVTSQILNPAYRNLNGWQVGKMLGCFYITVFLKNTDCFEKILVVIFISSCM